ncbi:DMT family transporter [Aneurinibacillus sp. REN35]|uniref:DMT family transporter n=1 Tax=Aneurinibacillus sp. REN35 TaxID=3237286 RepID=UPI00352761AF
MSVGKKVIMADVSLLGIALAWGYTFVLTKDLLNETSPLFLTGARFLLAALLLLCFKYNALKKAGWNVWKRGIQCGIPLWAGFALQTVGIAHTTPGKAGVLTGTVVIIVPLLSFIIMRSAVPKGAVIGSLLTFCGLALLSWDGGTLYMSGGDLLVLLCAVCFAIHILLVDRIYKQKESFDDLIFIMIQLLVVGVISLPLAFWFEPLPQLLSAYGWFAFGFDLLIGTLLAYIVQIKAQQYSPPAHVSLLLSLESFFAFLFSWLLWGEVITSSIIIGIFLILFGILVTEASSIFRPLKETSAGKEADIR